MEDHSSVALKAQEGGQMKAFDYFDTQSTAVAERPEHSLRVGDYRQMVVRYPQPLRYTQAARSDEEHTATAVAEPEIIKPPQRSAHTVLDHVIAGIAIITALHYGRPIGFTVNSLSQVSQQPPLLSFCADDSEANWPLVEVTDTFCVNILSEQQKDVCDVFARKGGTRFQSTASQITSSGIPILAGVLAWIECSVAAVFPAGDQVIVLGHVHHMDEVRKGKPLVYYRGTYGTFETS